MAAAKHKLKQAAALLKGIHNHSGFLADETLVHIVQSESTRALIESLINDHLRTFRDGYRDFEERSERYLRRNERKRYQELLTAWTQAQLSYLGYQSFTAHKLDHPEGGHIPYLAAAEDTHSVALFFCVHSDAPLSADQSSLLSTSSGEILYKPSLRPSLIEQVERCLKLCGRPEALLILPHAIYYFRAESQISGQCLEVRWKDIAADHDQALAVATYLLRAEFFAYSGSVEEEGETSEARDDEDDEDSEESGGSSGGSTRLTASAELFKEDLQQSRAITEELHKQVVLALEILINERLLIDPDLLKAAKHPKHNERLAQDLFKDGLFVLYRILFVLYAEARDFLPVDHPQFGSFYSLDHLRNWSENFLRKQKRGLANSEGTYIWGAIQSIFTLLRRGVRLSDGRMVSPYNGQLFAPDKAPSFDHGPALRDAAMAKVLTALSRVGGEQSGRRLHFGNLGIAQLGAVYESLLAQKPVIVREESEWVPAHGGGVGLVTKELADALDMKRFAVRDVSTKATRKTSRSKRGSDQDLSRFIAPERPAYQPQIGTFIVAPLGGQKRQTASFYTPPKLAEFLVQRTLKPLVEGKSSQEILKLKIVEPAMGSGGFLIATVRYLAEHLLKAKRKERQLDLRNDDERVQREALQRCKREVIESCIYGVDINPLAIELARTSLYLEALLPGEPLPFLHHRLRSGNSLVGAPLLDNAEARVAWEPGFEFSILFDLPIDHIKLDKKLLEAWDGIPGNRIDGKQLEEQWKNRLRELKAERRGFKVDTWHHWADASQTKVTSLLQKASVAQSSFDQAQVDNDIIDQLDDRYKDHKALIPDMDPVLIEAYGVEVDEILLKKRKQALMAEMGERRYQQLVMGQRSILRLRALGDLHCALWYWPLEAVASFPNYGKFRELVDWLLDEKSLHPKVRTRSLSKGAFSTLKTALRVARDKRFFHWDLEFASIFFGGERRGFDACLSNPPWKVVGVRDKEVYPAFDPQFLDTTPSRKKERIAKLAEHLPTSALAWYRQSFDTSRMTEHWRQGKLADIAPEGQVDLAVLFVLRSERLVRQKGRIGQIVSRSSLYVNKASKNIRQRFFEEWGLQESYSFANHLKLFEIDSRVEFTLVIGSPGSRLKVPRFVHALIDPNTLDVVGRNIEVKDVSQVVSGPKPIELNIEMIRSYFSKENLSIPGITDPRQLEIAQALHRASGPVTYLDQIEGITVMSGIHQTSGPKKGLSQYTEKIPPKELPKWEDVLAGKVGKWVPLYRGRNYNLFDPYFDVENTDSFLQYADRNRIEAMKFDFNQPILAWRQISQPTDTRTMICCLLPKGTFADGNNGLIQHKDSDLLNYLECVLSSIQADFIMKLPGGAKRTLGQLVSLPIPAYYTSYSIEAIKIAKKMRGRISGSSLEEISPRIDALIWLHYSFDNDHLNKGALLWMIESNFHLLKSKFPGYIDKVSKHYDEYSSSLAQNMMYTPIFPTSDKKKSNIK